LTSRDVVEFLPAPWRGRIFAFWSKGFHVFVHCVLAERLDRARVCAFGCSLPPVASFSGHILMSARSTREQDGCPAMGLHWPIALQRVAVYASINPGAKDTR